MEFQASAVTSVAETLLDMSPGQPVGRVERWIHEAGVMRVLDVREIWQVLEREQHHRGRVVLEAGTSPRPLGDETDL